jgi:excisionase family DNA binding protein
MTTAIAPAADPLPRYITVAEFCERFRLSKTFAYNLIQTGQIRSVKIGTSRRIPVAAIKEFEAGLKNDEAE